jgi:leucyl aminopeptidase
VSFAKKITKNNPSLSCKIFDEKKLLKMGAGGILCVAKGSKNKPAMIVLKYTPPKKTANTKSVALIGKAITFDSGGISLKPGAGMDQMKMDKGGGVAVIGAMKAIASLKPKSIVYGIICAAENMPSGESFRPGDIIKTLSGKTVEVLNTDAEGRLILCDGIHYAKTQKVDTIVDIATLTGACLVALGESKAGLFSNDPKLSKLLEESSKSVGEELWQLPCGKDYLEDLKSPIADLRNIGKTRWGSASSAAAFLGEFAKGCSWAHLDIAGPGMRDTKSRYGFSGVEAWGVRLLVDFVIKGVRHL